MRVIFAGGGTAGHLLPALVIADELRRRNIDTFFIVSDRGIERDLLTSKGYPYYEQKLKPFKRTNVFNQIFSILLIFIESLKLLYLIKKREKILLLGGFASLPSGIAGFLKRCELYIHEQNSSMGLANRIIAPLAKKVFLSFENTNKAKGKTFFTGYPVRQEFKLIKEKEKFEKRILVLGGSQGSRMINQLIVSSALLLLERGYHIAHQTGKKLFDETIEMYKKEGLLNIKLLNIFPFHENIASFYSWADIIIGRSGAGTVFEILSARRPAIFIPLKTAADNHQYYNAQYASKSGFVFVLKEDEANVESLIKLIYFIAEKYDSEIKEKLISFNDVNSTEIIMEAMNVV
jgi:UDP-N-acetylglucosamine--N-acetylmuramyl-(pentapeptide) pyrophosphoryl-undecaprenol N-acetylglucosamine transferase